MVVLEPVDDRAGCRLVDVGGLEAIVIGKPGRIIRAAMVVAGRLALGVGGGALGRAVVFLALACTVDASD
ncbi:hypothetical protein GCM10008164_09620 [Achromobacter xylosoxidans]|nr:hypothetical protein GCM10008164_09620 [Achromobacter xylosoxidans]